MDEAKQKKVIYQMENKHNEALTKIIEDLPEDYMDSDILGPFFLAISAKALGCLYKIIHISYHNPERVFDQMVKIAKEKAIEQNRDITTQKENSQSKTKGQ